MKNRMTHRTILAAALCAVALPATVWADNNGNGNGNGSDNNCTGLPTYSQLKSALTLAINAEGTGFNLNMWGTIVNRDGVVCAAAFTGNDRGAQWPGSRVISAQKANTANAFSLDGLVLSTANLYSAVQPGGSLFGLQESNPVDVNVAYKGPSSNYGKSNDPMVGEKIGGVNVFGGGLGLYTAADKIIGAVGVSGDSSCEDHRVAWRVRSILHLDNVVGKGVVGGTDNMVFDIAPNVNGGTGISAGGWGHPHCISVAADGNPATLPAAH